MGDLPEWRFLTAVPDGEALTIGGLDPWEHVWRRVGGTAEVRDPRYHQLFRISIYDIGDAERPVRFAAGEFSNGIWGFYLPS